jgi:threonine dehydratase
MVGGCSSIESERIVAFEFPERSGALMEFLDSMDHPWNISLFHYRNHGSDVGRVLAGVQVPPDEGAVFDAFLERLGYECTDVTNDLACQMFLRA